MQGLENLMSVALAFFVVAFARLAFFVVAFARLGMAKVFSGPPTVLYVAKGVYRLADLPSKSQG